MGSREWGEGGDEIWEVGSAMRRKERSCIVKQEEKDPVDESTAPPGTAPDGFSSYSQDVVFQQTGSRGEGCEAVIWHVKPCSPWQVDWLRDQEISLKTKPWSQRTTKLKNNLNHQWSFEEVLLTTQPKFQKEKSEIGHGAWGGEGSWWKKSYRNPIGKLLVEK